MGGAKKAMQEHQDKLAIALEIAVQAGAIKTCDLHSDVYLQGREDVGSAYKLGNSQYTAGKLEGLFKDRREMTDLIKEAVEYNSGDECYICAKSRDD